MDNMNWRKSSYSSGNGGECIEVASPEGAVAVRDTKQDGVGPVLRFTPAAWHRFADQVKQSLASDLQRGRPARSGRHRTGCVSPIRSAQKVRSAGRRVRPCGLCRPHGGRRVLVPDGHLDEADDD